MNASDGLVGMCHDRHPYTMFKLQPLHEDVQEAFIRDAVGFRLEHTLSGRWLHGDKDLVYHSHQPPLLSPEKLLQVGDVIHASLFNKSFSLELLEQLTVLTHTFK